MNLTAITEPEDVARLHLLDSLYLLKSGGLGKTVVDVGTGAGFPGMPLAIAAPSIEVTLLDSLGKRIAFLEEAAGALGIQNVKCVQARAEEFAVEKRESFDGAVSRAVAALPVLCELCLPLVKVGGVFVAMKSSHTEEEIEQAKRAVKLLGGRIVSVEDYRIPTPELVHRLVKVEK
ncbi:MAG: 16S rRNA (guanine(527)-N(7))-methyltransferase RsmG, partial [Oscillospiraceae bacterium]|nr:16S rRNA (guanine(527)-N(7))-methyltransferase RsmG [Oscillospiraceae bacterium]